MTLWRAGSCAYHATEGASRSFGGARREEIFGSKNYFFGLFVQKMGLNTFSSRNPPGTLPLLPSGIPGSSVKPQERETWSALGEAL